MLGVGILAVGCLELKYKDVNPRGPFLIKWYHFVLFMKGAGIAQWLEHRTRD